MPNAKDKWYFFGDNNHNVLISFHYFAPHSYLKEWSSLLSLYNPPPFFGAPTSLGVSFGIGAGGSGVPFHIHGAVFAEVFHGKKV
jgi:hypothetical protein